MECVVCHTRLIGRQTKYCSGRCKSEAFQHSYQYQQDRGLRRKLELIDRLGGKCSECGYCRNLSALEFHHYRGKKKFRLDMRNLANRSWASILTEVKKCKLVCANCHAEIHNPNLVL